MKKWIFNLIILCFLCFSAISIVAYTTDSVDPNIRHYGSFKLNTSYVNDNWNFVHYAGCGLVYNVIFNKTRDRGKSFLYTTLMSISWEIIDAYKPLYHVEGSNLEFITRADGFSWSDILIGTVGTTTSWMISLRLDVPWRFELYPNMIVLRYELGR